MKVLINSISYPYVPGSISIDTELSSRATAELEVLHDVNTHFSRSTQIEIQDDLGAAVFKGFLSPTENIQPDMKTIRSKLDCVNSHYLCDKRVITAAPFSSQAAGTTVAAILASPLAAEGITAGVIEAGQTLGVLDFTNTKCSSALQDLAEGTGFIWYLDMDRALHFRDPGSVLAPWDLVWENVIAGSLEVAKVSREYRNRVRVRGSSVALADSAGEQARLAAIESSSGIVEDVLEGVGYASYTSAQTAAEQVRDVYAQEETLITFKTRKKGLVIGQTMTSRLAEHSIDGTSFLITAVSMQEDHSLDSAGVLYTISAVNGPTSAGWATRMGRLMSRGEAIDRLASRTVAAGLQIFIATGIWTKPTGCTAVEVWFFSGGGGGGGGAKGNGTNRGGGAGGGGGNVMVMKFDGDDLSDSEDVTVPIVSGGGTGATASNSDGVAGLTGASPEFHGWKVFGATGGGKGTTSSATGGSGCQFFVTGQTFTGGSPTGGTGTLSGVGGSPNSSFNFDFHLPGSGGGGGGAAGVNASQGGSGGGYATGGSGPITRLAGGLLGATFSNGGNGNPGTLTFQPGTGGGGGGSCNTVVGPTGNGGAGGFPGGGGGGGGGGVNAIANGGQGGNGGGAQVVIIST